MVVFNDGELEIAIVTYKRPDFIRIWLEKCYQPAVDRNISISIYDSSPDNDTALYLEHFNAEHERHIQYYRVDENTIIGYKPMIPILRTESEYLWVCGDSRYQDFEELDKKIFPYLRDRNVDYAVINYSNASDVKEGIYDTLDSMIKAVYVPSTCIGMSIFRKDIFKQLKENKELLSRCNRLFENNYGFAWMGYFYSCYSMGDYKTLLANVKTFTILDKSKKQTWAVRFYGCWVDDLCGIVDGIPEKYRNKEKIPHIVWSTMKLDSISYCYRARKYGDLNRAKYGEMERCGLLSKIIDRPYRMKFFANAPIWLVEMVYLAYRIKRKWTFLGGGLV